MMALHTDGIPTSPKSGRRSGPFPRKFPNEPQMRHRRIAERRQVHAVQCADQGGNRRRELSVLHDRAERGHRRGARSAPGDACGDPEARAGDAGGRRVRRHRRARRRRVEGRGTRQPVPREHPRDRCDRARRPLLRGRQRRARGRQDQSDLGHRDDQHRTGARRHGGRGQAAREVHEGRALRRRQGGRADRRGAREGDGRAERGAAGADGGPRARGHRGAAAVLPADDEADDVRRERRRARLPRQPAARPRDRAREARRRAGGRRMRIDGGGDRRPLGRGPPGVHGRHGAHRARARPRDPCGVRAARSADVFHRRTEGSARVDDPRRRHGAARRPR